MNSIGPLEYLVVEFPGNQFKGEIAPALKAIVEKGLIRIIDLLIMIKDSDGEVAIVELNDLDPNVFGVFDPIVSDVTELLSESDVAEVSSMLSNNSSAAMMLFEHTWATQFRDSLVNANGRMVANGRIPYDVVQEALAWQEENRLVG